MLAKKFKKETTPYSNYFRDVEAQVAANQMAIDFNKFVKQYNIGEIRHLSVAVLQIKEDDTTYSFWGIERNSQEHFIRFNNNAGHLKEDHPLPQAFVHYSYRKAHGEFLYCDLQGWRNGDLYLLTDTMRLKKGKVKEENLMGLVMEKHPTNSITGLCRLPICQRLRLGGVQAKNLFVEESPATTLPSEATQTQTHTQTQTQTQTQTATAVRTQTLATQTQTRTYIEPGTIPKGDEDNWLEADTGECLLFILSLMIPNQQLTTQYQYQYTDSADFTKLSV